MPLHYLPDRMEAGVGQLSLSWLEPPPITFPKAWNNPRPQRRLPKILQASPSDT